jgi:hypothetical protein
VYVAVAETPRERESVAPVPCVYAKRYSRLEYAPTLR